MSRKTLIQNNLLILIGGNFSSLLNYLLNIVLLRIDKLLFNEYTIISSIALILFVPSLIIYRVFGAYGDRIFAEVKEKFKNANFILVTIISTIVSLILTFFVVLNLIPNKSYFTAFLLIILTLGIIVINMYRGIRQYREDFINYVITLNIEAGFRSVFGFVLAYYFKLGIDGILIGHILGLVVCWLISQTKVSNITILDGIEELKLKKIFITSLILTLGLEFFTNFDILYSNSILNTNLSSQTEYNTILFFRKIIFFSIFIFCGLILSITGKKNKSSKYTFYYTLLTGVGIGVMLSIGFLITKNIVLGILNQQLQNVSLPFMILFLIGTIFMSTAYLLSNWLYATGKTLYTLIPALACILEIGTFIFLGKDFTTLIRAFFYSSAIFFVLTVIIGIKESYFGKDNIDEDEVINDSIEGNLL